MTSAKTLSQWGHFDSGAEQQRAGFFMIEEMLRRAVLGKNLVEFNYEGRVKVVEPHLVGHNMRGHLLLTAWFVRGDAKFSEEGLQDYMLVGISNLKILPEAFLKPRFGYNPMDDRKYANIHFCL